MRTPPIRRTRAADAQRRKLIGNAAVLATASLAGLGPRIGAAAATDEPWPTRPLTMVVPFPPGGVADLVGRPVAAALERTLGQPVIVENRAGAGGGIGMSQVARSKPDGYTVLMALSSISILPEADRVLGRTPMYALRDLVPIARFTADPVVLVVRTESPWKTLAEFIADAKRRPGQIGYGSSGNYGTMHVPVEAWAQQAQLKLLHVPYTGAGPAIVGLLGSQVDAIAAGPSAVIQHIKAGKLRPLAGWGNTRVQALPDVPTLKESGFDVEFAQWSGLFVPAGTPEPVIAKLRAAARAAAQDPRLQQAMDTLQTPLQYLDAPEFLKYWERDAATLAEVVRRIGKVE